MLSFTIIYASGLFVLEQRKERQLCCDDFFEETAGASCSKEIGEGCALVVAKHVIAAFDASNVTAS